MKKILFFLAFATMLSSTSFAQLEHFTELEATMQQQIEHMQAHHEEIRKLLLMLESNQIREHVLEKEISNLEQLVAESNTAQAEALNREEQLKLVIQTMEKDALNREEEITQTILTLQNSLAQYQAVETEQQSGDEAHSKQIQRLEKEIKTLKKQLSMQQKIIAHLHHMRQEDGTTEE